MQSLSIIRRFSLRPNSPDAIRSWSSLPQVRLGRNVREAMANSEPIVALESTVITHGLPEGQNLQLALSLEEEIKAVESATPATIGIIKGQIVIGLDRNEIEYLASKELSKPIKASRRDIPIAMARKLSAGTTVAATMAIATMIQAQESRFLPPIRVFATGGTGGVHIGGQDSLDISADLYEFARSPMCVVSSGFKSFLDTRRSLEVLETFGCTVMSLHEAQSTGPEPSDGTKSGPTSEVENDEAEGSDKSSSITSIERGSNEEDYLFPGFFTTNNWQQVRSPCIVRSTSEAAQIVFRSLEGPLANQRASLLAVPIPREFALDGENDEQLQRAMEDIIQIDKRTDLEGKEKTPLILAQLNRATGGKTLKANIELLKNNSRIGAQLAVDYAQMSNRGGARGAGK